MRLRLPIAVVAAGGLLAGSADRLAAQEEDAPEPPVEFTACVFPGPEVGHGTDERTVVALSDGDMTIDRQRGFTWRLVVSAVSDPRLEGTWYHSYDADSYTLPGDEAGPTFAVYTNRIENDEGAWQGSAVDTGFPDGTSSSAPLVLIGGGAYAGLTAIVAPGDFAQAEEGCPNTRGYIIEGSIPTPPVPSPRR